MMMFSSVVFLDSKIIKKSTKGVARFFQNNFAKVLAVLVFGAVVNVGWGQTFTGTYSFASATGNVASLSYNGTTISNLTVSALVKTGVTTSASTGNSRATGWDIGSTNGAAAGGSVNTGKYYEFSITAGAGYTISNPTLSFGVGRSGTGPRRFQWRWNVDSYGTPLSVGTANVSLTNTSGVLESPDANSSWTGNSIITTTSGQTTITFRFYAYGAEDALAGTGGLQGNLTFGGTLTAATTSYSLTYNGNGNTSGTTPVDASSPYAASASVTTLTNIGSLAKTGSTFAGWNTLATGLGTDIAVNSAYTMPTTNTILYAKWTANTLIVTYDSQGGNTILNGSTTTGGTVADPGNPARVGYGFNGWFTAASGGTAITFPYTHGQTADFTLYAQWSANNNTLTFDGNGATSGATASQTIATNASATLTSNGFINTGYNFTGWSTTAGGSVAYVDGASYTMGTSNATLAAVWTIATLPTISYSGSLVAVNTTYGTASATPATFSVSGSALTNNITLTAPAGFEFSSGSGYSTSLTLTLSGGVVSSTPIYVRLAATTVVGTYSGNIVLTSSGATSVNVATVSSTVDPKGLTISGLTGANKEYDGTTAATFTGTATYVGLVNGETFPVSGTPSATFNSAGAGTSVQITLAGYTAPSANYTLTQPTLSGDITAKALTVSGASAANKPYDGTTTATITGGSLVGVVSPDVVTLIQSGNFVSANLGTGITVTPNLSISGTDAGNYTLTQPSGLIADITQASQTITFSALVNQTVGVADYAPGATASSGLTVTYTSSNPAVAIIVGGLIHVVGAGTTTITASQVGNGNYLAASDVNQSLTVNNLPLAAWEVGGLVGGANNFGPNPLDTISANQNVLITKLTRAVGIILTSGTAAGSAWGGTGVNSSSFANAVTGNDFITFGVQAKPGYTASFSEIPAYNIRRSATGAPRGQWQYQLNNGSFVNIGDSITWGGITNSTGNLQSSINLSTITALQNVASNVNVTFRLVVWGGSSSSGTWYINNISGNDLQVTGTVNVYISGLPIELISFQAKCAGNNDVDITWSTASEHNTKHFIVEKSRDGVNWVILNTLAAAGNSTSVIEYAITDTDVTNGTSYYRLTQFDTDGASKKFNITSVNCGEQRVTSNLVTYPNPSNGSFYIDFYSHDVTGPSSVSVSDSRGLIIYRQDVLVEKESNVFHIEDLEAAPGIYYIQISNGTTNSYIVKHSLR